jgi:hypothetical protein
MIGFCNQPIMCYGHDVLWPPRLSVTVQPLSSLVVGCNQPIMCYGLPKHIIGHNTSLVFATNNKRRKRLHCNRQCVKRRKRLHCDTFPARSHSKSLTHAPLPEPSNLPPPNLLLRRRLSLSSCLSASLSLSLSFYTQPCSRRVSLRFRV